MLRWLLGIGCFFLLSVPSLANGYRSYYYPYQKSYYPQQQYAPQTVYPILVPAYQFQYQPPVTIQAAPKQSVLTDKDSMRELAKALLVEIRQQEAGEDLPPVAIDPLASQSPPPAVPQEPEKVATMAFARNCASCHTGIGAKGDVAIFMQPGILNPKAPWGAMLGEIQAGRMPPKTSQYKPTPKEQQEMLMSLQGKIVEKK